MKLKRLLSCVTAAVMDLSVAAVASFSTASSEDNPYAKIIFKGYNQNEITIAQGTADESMAGATQVKVTFQLGPNAAFNQLTSISFSGKVGSNTIEASVTGEGWPDSGTTGHTGTIALSTAVASGDTYKINANSDKWETCTTEDNYIFGINKVEFLDASGNVLKTQTEVGDSSGVVDDPDPGLTDLSDNTDSSEPTSFEEPSSDSSQGPSSNSVKDSTTASVKTTATTTATTANAKAVQATKDKAEATKAMKQAKITKLTVKSKAKKKITVSWKKVKKAKGYQVQVSKKKNFKKNIVNKLTSKKKLTIKNSKIKSKKTYYVRVRAYATYKDANNKAIKVYSAWNKKLCKITIK